MALGATEANIASLPKQQSDGYREHYANNCQIRFTPFYVTILFTFLKEWDGQIVNEAQTAVTLSPLQFKALLLTGATLLEGFEQTFGELALPPGIGPQKLGADIAAEMRVLASTVSAQASSTEQPQHAKRSRVARKKKGL
jgi:hypothetical protein